MPTVFGRFDSLARFTIISMVSPVFLHTASSQTHSESVTYTNYKGRHRKQCKTREREMSSSGLDMMTSEKKLQLK